MKWNATVQRGVLGVYLLVLSLLLLWLLVAFWPIPVGVDPSQWNARETILWWEFSLDPERRFLLLVLIAAAFGSYVHAATSFVTYVGNESFAKSWAWWYALRPFIGMSLALVFYCVVRGGLLVLSNGSAAGTDRMATLYAMAGLAGLVGLCSKQAADKLQDIFNNAFRTPAGEGDDARKDKLGEQIPVSKVMIPVSEITKVQIAPAASAKSITLAQVYAYLKKKPVTRIPVLDQGGAAKYIVHDSTFYKFIADAVAAKKKPDLANMTLEDFLNAGDNRARVSKSMAFAPIGARLGEARSTMMENAGCRDIFVTQSGKPDEPVLGWLTNVDIEKHCRA